MAAVHLTRRLSRIALGATALLLSATLAACGGTPTDTPAPEASPTAVDTASAEPTPTRDPIPVSDSVDGIEVAGELGAAPTVTVPTPFAIDETRSRTLVEGDAASPAAEADGIVEVQYVGVNGRTGETFDSSWDRGKAGLFDLQRVVPGFTKGLTGTKPGQRILVAMPGSDGYDAQGGQAPAIEVGDTLVFVVDVVAVSTKSAVGTAETPQLPVTLGEADGKPTVTIDTAATPPADLVAVPVITGTQRAVGAEDYVLAHYRTYSWKTGEMIEDKFDLPQAGVLSETIEAWKQGLAGQTIGSRVVIIAPPKVAYEKSSFNPPVEAGDTVVYVIDILMSSAVA